MKELRALITEFAMACHAEAKHLAKGNQVPLGDEEKTRAALEAAIELACLKRSGHTADLELRKLYLNGDLCEVSTWPTGTPDTPGMSFFYLPPEMVRGFTVGDTLRVTVHLELAPKAHA